MKRAGSQPLASVVICSYNYGRFLAEAIESALNQTYPHVEVVVVDDGSTDDSRDVIRKYGDRVLAIFQENEGHDAAVNTGFRAASGDAVCFLDSDDALLPTAVEEAVRAMRDPDVVKVHWPLLVIDERGVRTGGTVPSGPLPEGDLRDVVIQHGPQSYPTPPTSGHAWRRRFLDEVCPLAIMENRAGTADDQLSMLAPLFGRVSALSAQGFFRAHGGNHYWGRTLEHLAMTLRDYERYCRVLGDFCRAKGFRVDENVWKRESWFHRLHVALQDVLQIVPPTDTFILVDNDKWGTGTFVGGRRCVPFPERGGTYSGKPADDREAFDELGRLQRLDADFLVIGWPAFWWIDSYPSWYRRLQSDFPCVLSNERVQVFDLQRRARLGAHR